ncbi:glutamate--cysteine ligase [Arthrobacter sp. VKM Ac-2550]|uniref:carboxylate-amine ligase n=1 Tax=Crystallibacter permensis TaxID=1938888 RepID=UPI00222745FD|nr:glutamate--cysteine ligase [Arthrobacter sp. VKM Ac-2550]MCW2135377.1 carboxylate-amine ligase [Arthrobacter sp. VKM Ac-2550]
MRTFGVEEELLLVDSTSWRVVPRVSSLMNHYGQQLPQTAQNLPSDPPSPEFTGPRLATEFQQEQIEVISRPHSSVGDLAADIRTGRALADSCAGEVGARTAALATAPLPAVPHPAPDARVGTMTVRYGLTAREQLTCGCHVHVSVDSDEEGIAVLDRVRIWLPVLAALASNSPFSQGADTGYASFRGQAWSRWPSTGPLEIFGSAAAYHRTIEQILATGVVLDKAMLYFDARLSNNYPTVEIRVSDVCLDADDTVLIAALARALVETAARDWRSGKDPEPVPVAILRLAAWQASRWGTEADLLHPVTGVPCKASDVIGLLLEHVSDALADYGDEARVRHLYGQLLQRGTGARQQRDGLERTGSLEGVVAEAVRLTHSQNLDIIHSGTGRKETS